MTEILSFLTQYGYLAMYILLALGVLGIPVPDETLMVTFGGMTAQGQFHFAGALTVTFLGSMTGMMISYMLGRIVGKPLLHRYGKWIWITPKRIDSTEVWFKRYGSWSIVLGYFVPGVRHLSSYMAGVAKLSIKQFLVYAATGALLWCTTFLLIGHAAGYHWGEMMVLFRHSTIRIGIIIVGLIAVVSAGMVWWKKRSIS
ncbi:DedA family protein [Paenibacillus pini]|uniref:YbfM protein n=1 Tax=Paenibacillus pini JCM 16418 TaxID=1236976 RepID=W7YPA4_9BACL|nr:DedA family protein [Paenibacillus pini]GAF06516.1 YbfM protein [Paenibacillus pini JCM 16418]